MAAETITVYIDPNQLVAQKQNEYSLFLAKMVDGQFTVIWQSMGPIATVNAPSYESLNTFQLGAPGYQVNYGMITDQGGPTFSPYGIAQDIELGQTVVLDQDGIFGGPTNGGVAGQITIDNALLGNPHVVLNDGAGNPIFVNLQSGMDIGATTLTPQDTYQIWFDNYQERGTIIAHNVSNAGIFTFGGDTTNLVISYGAEGEWRPGPLPTPTQVEGQAVGGQASAHPFAIVVNFDRGLDWRAKEYVRYRLHRDFPSERRPMHHMFMGDLQLWLYFDGSLEIDGPADLAATDATLTRAKADSTSGLERNSWTLHLSR